MKKLILYCFIILPALQGFTQNIPYPVVPDWESTPSGHVATGLGLADINGDGWKDIIVANGNDMQRQSLVVYYNRGDGSFGSVPDWQSQDIDYHGHLAVGDLNADGWPDVAVSVYIGTAGFGSPGKLKIYFNNAGVLEDTPSFESNDFYTFSCAMGDADGDGDLDIAVAAGESYNEIYDQGKIFYNNDGVFSQTPGWTTSVSFSTLDVDFGDVDGNGKLDVVFANERGPNYLFLADNSGEISNTASWESSENPVFMNSLDIGKIGEQKTTGVVFSGNNQLGGDGKIKLYTFDDEVPPASEAVWSSQVAGYWSGILLHDVDLDGLTDLIYGGWWLPLNIHLGNEENFDDLPAYTSQTSSVVEAIQIADLNQDGMEELAEIFQVDEQYNSLFYLSHPIESVVQVLVSDVGIGPEQYCYVPGKNWLSLSRELVSPDVSVLILYKYSRKGDIVVTNWDGTKGNYIFYNDTILTSIGSNIQEDFDFRIYPNPVTTGRVVVTFNELIHGTVHISLTDISGQLLNEETKIITKGQRTLYLDLHQIPKGVYLIRLANDHFIKTKKLIIQ